MLFLPVALAAKPPVQQEENMLSGGGCAAARPHARKRYLPNGTVIYANVP